MTTWFTSDTHFGHANIIRLSNRPFTDVVDMDRTLIDNINKKVKSNDTLYHLGDFAWGNESMIKYYRDKIFCNNIIFIYGNHDKPLEANRKFTLEMFSEAHVSLERTIQGQYIHMFHFPILEWDGFWRASWHVFGHVHGAKQHPEPRAWDVGVDVNDYAPISFEELSERIKK